MKSILIILAIVLSLTTFAQTTLKYQGTGIEITNPDATFSTGGNVIGYKISANLSDADSLLSVFPSIEFKLENGKLVYKALVNAPLNEIIKVVKVDNIDLNKSIEDVIKRWSIQVIYSYDLLKLHNYQNWVIQ